MLWCMDNPPREYGQPTEDLIVSINKDTKLSEYGIERCSGRSWVMGKCNTWNSQGIHKTTKDLFPGA